MTIHDRFDKFPAELINPLERGFSITPADDTDLEHVTREIFVGTGGDLVLILKHGDEVTLVNVPDGSRLPYRAAQVSSTGTTAADIVGLY